MSQLNPQTAVDDLTELGISVPAEVREYLMEEGRQVILLHFNDSSQLIDPQLTCDCDYPRVTP